MTDNQAPVAPHTLDFATLATALALFRIDCRRYPTTDEGLRALLAQPSDSDISERWQGPYVGEIESLQDPWGRDLHYVCPGSHNPFSYDLSSAGPDGQLGSSDDICNWRQRPAATEAPRSAAC